MQQEEREGGGFKLPGTLEVLAVWTVAGVAWGTTAGCADAGWVGLVGCVETIPGLWATVPGLLSGINPRVGVSATTWGILWPGITPGWDDIEPSEPGPGGPDWKLELVDPCINIQKKG